MNAGSVLDKPIVLVLNRVWQRLKWITPRQAFTAMCGGIYGGTQPFKGLAISTDENGELVEGIPLNWEEWVKLPIRECDFAISTRSGAVRVPSVVITPEYDKMPVKSRRLTGKGIRDRDKGICQVSGRLLADGEGNLGHIHAKAKGGARTWENLVYMDRRLNTLQGTNTPEEMGWKLLSEPRAPAPLPACVIVNEKKHTDHGPFVT